MTGLREESGIPKGAPKTETLASKRMINVDKLAHEMLVVTTSVSPRSTDYRTELSLLMQRIANIRSNLREGRFDA